MRNLRILGGYQNTKDNKEDLAITPYLFLVSVNIKTTKKIRIYGIGICWIHYSFYIGIGINVPRIYPSFRNSSKKLLL